VGVGNERACELELKRTADEGKRELLTWSGSSKTCWSAEYSDSLSHLLTRDGGWSRPGAARVDPLRDVAHDDVAIPAVKVLGFSHVPGDVQRVAEAARVVRSGKVAADNQCALLKGRWDPQRVQRGSPHPRALPPGCGGDGPCTRGGPAHLSSHFGQRLSRRPTVDMSGAPGKTVTDALTLLLCCW
jgi:hypothetical protein